MSDEAALNFDKNVGGYKTWERTGQHRWYTRLAEETPPGDALTVLQECWQCRETGEARWQPIENAMSPGVAAQRQRMKDMTQFPTPKES